MILTLLYLYLTRNFGKVVGLESPEPLANLYTRSYFRATWVTTALDAGFWTAMHVRPRWLRDISSVVFTLYYLVCAEQADEKVRKVRAGLTLEHMRISWDKPNTPYIRTLTNLLRPKLTKYKYPPRELRIPRPQQSSYNESIKAWLYFDGPLSGLQKHDKIILDIPGGGFVAMDPRCHDDKLIGWAGRTGLPILALDYRKAPEHPYPYALNECYDAYHTLVATRGQCIGLSGHFMPKIVVSGDSAGGNLAVGLVLMILQSGSTDSRRWHGENLLPLPDGVVLSYPALDVNIGNWMTDEQMALIKDRRSRKTNQGVIRRKSDDYRKLTPDTPLGSEDEDESDTKKKRRPSAPPDQPNTSAAHTVDTIALKNTEAKPMTMKTRLAMSSMISYFNDRILTPEMMRAMIILYIGPHSRPDFATDYLLSPLLAPENLLMRFPKTYFLTGERDPLVDDTVIFAGRLRQAKLAQWRERQELGLISSRETFHEEDWVNVALIPGISHGFLQFVSIYPEGWKYIFRAAKWMSDIFREVDLRALRELEKTERQRRRHLKQVDAALARVSDQQQRQQLHQQQQRSGGPTSAAAGDDDSDSDDGISVSSSRPRHHRRMRTGSSGDDDRPLEMSAIRPSPKKLAPMNGSTPSTATGGSGTPALAGKAPRLTPECTIDNLAAAAAVDGKDGVIAGQRGKMKRPVDMADRRGKARSIASLASSEDLLGRRMNGLAGSLLGRLGEGEGRTP